jgi:hypothetical protein
MWASILTNIIAAAPIYRISMKESNQSGPLAAFLLTLGVLLIYGVVLGTLFFGINFLIRKKESMLKRKPTNESCIVLAIIVILLASIGNFGTLIIFGCYLILRAIIWFILKKKRSKLKNETKLT